jgi:photosystem II stability/assembly factor-like uncharacterized protein
LASEFVQAQGVWQEIPSLRNAPFHMTQYKGHELLASAYPDDQRRSFLYRSKDLGKTWEPISESTRQLLTDQKGNYLIYDNDYPRRASFTKFVPPPYVDDTYYIFQGEMWIYDMNVLLNNDYFLATSKGLFQSKDENVSWQVVALKDTVVREIHVTPSQKILAGTENGLRISEDGGKTFARKTLIGHHIVEIASEEMNNKWVVLSTNNTAGSDKSETFIHISIDEGRTWRSQNTGIENLWASPRSLAVHNQSIVLGDRLGLWVSSDEGQHFRRALHNLTVFSVITAENVFIATTAGGIYRSEDEGITWDWVGVQEMPIRTLIADSGTLYAFNNGNTFSKTTDMGSTWTQKTLFPVVNFLTGMQRFENGNLYVISQSRIYESSNKGETWSETQYPYQILIASGNGQGLLGRSDKNELFLSDNKGLSWVKIDPSLSLAQVLGNQANYAFDHSNRLYLRTSLGIFTFDKNLNRAKKIYDCGGNCDPYDLWIGAKNELFLFNLYTGQDISISNDQGEHWEQVKIPYQFDLGKIIYTRSGNIFGVAKNSNTFVHTNNFKQWQSISLPTNPTNINALGWTCMDVDKQGNVYLSFRDFDGKGFDSQKTRLFIAPKAIAVNREVEEAPLEHWTLEAYPNPSKDEINLEIHLGETASVQVNLYNLLGQKQAILMPEQVLSAGSHPLRIETKFLSSGSYFVVMEGKGQRLLKKVQVLR